MIEIINICFQSLIFILLSIFGPFSINIYNKEKKYSFFETIICSLQNNLLFYLSLIWLCFIFNINKEYFYAFILSLFSVFFFINHKNSFNKKIIITILLIFIPLFVLSIDLGYNLFLGHDSRKFHIVNATIFYEGLFVNDITYKNEYPLFGNYLWAFFWKNSILKIEYFGRIIFVYIYLLSLFYVFSSLRVKIISKIFLITAGLLITYNFNYFDGRTDILIFALLLIVAKNLYEFFYLKKIVNKNIFPFLISLNLLLWIKSESLLYVAVICMTVIFFLNIKLKYKLFVFFYYILIFLVKIIFNIHYNLPLNPNVETFDFYNLPVSSLSDFFYRTFQIIFWYLANLLKNPFMLINFFCFYLLIFKFNIKIKHFYFLIFMFFIILTSVYLTFLISIYSFPFHLIGSLDRIIYQTSGLFIIPTLYFLDYSLKKKQGI